MHLKNKILTTILLISQLTKTQISHHFGVFPTIDNSGNLFKKFNSSLNYYGGFNLINSEINRIKENTNFFVFYPDQVLTYKVNSKLSITGSYVHEMQQPI